MEVNHLIERLDEEAHDNRIGVLQPDRCRCRPQLALHVFRLENLLCHPAGPDRFQAGIHVGPEKGANLVAPLREHRRAQVGRPDRVGLVEHQLFPGIEARRRHPERERQHERQQPQRGSNHRTDRRILLAIRSAVPVTSQPVAALDGCQDEHNDDEEQAPQREHVEDGRVLRHHGGADVIPLGAGGQPESRTL